MEGQGGKAELKIVCYFTGVPLLFVRVRGQISRPFGGEVRGLFKAALEAEYKIGALEANVSKTLCLRRRVFDAHRL